MRNDELNVALDKYFNTENSERTKELEGCKDVAFEIWDKICEIYTNFSPKFMKLSISAPKIILKYNLGCEEISITFPCSNPTIIEFVYIIAGHSDIKGKVFGQPNGLNFIFSYK